MSTAAQVIRYAVQAWARPFWRWQDLAAHAEGEFPPEGPKWRHQHRS